MTTGASSQLTVAVRIRPLNNVEKRRNDFQCATVVDEHRVILIDPEKFSGDVLRQNRQHERQFSFNAALGPNANHLDVHRETTQPLVDWVLQGYNATVFAYGATGKTYTMLGTDQQPGLMTLITQSLYDKIESMKGNSNSKYSVCLSYLEVYNELIRDLLNPSSGILELLEDNKGRVQVPGLSRVSTDSYQQILELLQRGNKRRTQEATDVNQTSSRSHALLQVSIKKNGIFYGKLFLIDLAGSERASHTNNRGQRLKEGAAINRSLLALGNVINSLSSQNKMRYVNYRDSKLTRLLKDSLGGNSKTCMIAHCSAASFSYEETHNTLVYASRAMNITTRPSPNNQTPSSADERYEVALAGMHHEMAERRLLMPRSESSHQLFDKRLHPPSTIQSPRLARPNNNRRGVDTKQQQKFTPSLFSTLKEQYLSITQKENQLRKQLLLSNEAAYDAEMNMLSKKAILTAWERQNTTIATDDKSEPESISRLRTDYARLVTKFAKLEENRRKIESSLTKHSATAINCEQRMRTLAKTAEQIELINMMSKLRRVEAHKIASESDSALLNRRLRMQENSLRKVRKYGVVADQLIERQLIADEANANDSDQQLYHNYRLYKNQMQYHMIQARQDNPISWNRQLLGVDDSITDLSKKHTIKRASDVHLPAITTTKDDIQLYLETVAHNAGSLSNRRIRSVSRLPAVSDS